MAVEQAEYEIVSSYPGFELRRYAPMLVAETRVSGGFDAVGNRAFRRLADFIFGANAPREKIAMTAPVIQEPAGSTAADSVPAEGTYTLAFVMPARFDADTLPAPTDPGITIVREPARLMAALRYSGRWTYDNYSRHERALLQAVRAAGLDPVGAPLYARYDPPFMPWFLRRNEVLVEIAEFAERAD